MAHAVSHQLTIFSGEEHRHDLASQKKTWIIFWKLPQLTANVGKTRDLACFVAPWTDWIPRDAAARGKLAWLDGLRRDVWGQIEIDFHCWRREGPEYRLSEEGDGPRDSNSPSKVLSKCDESGRMKTKRKKEKQTLMYSCCGCNFPHSDERHSQADFFSPFFFPSVFLLSGSSVIFILTQIGPRLHLGFPARQTFAWIDHFPFWQWHSGRCFGNTRTFFVLSFLMI